MAHSITEISGRQVPDPRKDLPAQAVQPACPLDPLDTVGPPAGEAVVEVEDPLAETTSHLRGAAVRRDPYPDTGPGDPQADPVLAFCVVGDPGEPRADALVPAHRQEPLP